MPKKKTEKKAKATKVESTIPPSKKTVTKPEVPKAKTASRTGKPAVKPTASKPTASKPAASKPAPARARQESQETIRQFTEETIVITEEHITIRAYFISEQRLREGRDGDPVSDWLEAERQLRGH